MKTIFIMAVILAIGIVTAQTAYAQKLPSKEPEIQADAALRLQAATDRLSHLFSTLSNVLKKNDNIDRALTQNIK